MNWNWDRFFVAANFSIILVGGIAATYEWMTFKRTFDIQTLKQIDYANEQLKIALGADKQRPYDYDGDLQITEVKKFGDGTSLYDVSLDVTNKNISKSLLHISYSSAELYLGTPSGEKLPPSTAIAVNDAPDPWHPQQSGLISWQRVGYQADIDDGPTNPTVLKWMHDRYASIGHGGLTGILASGTTNEFEPEYLIRAKSNQYVSIAVSFGINDSLDVASPDVGLVVEKRILADTDTKGYGSADHLVGPKMMWQLCLGAVVCLLPLSHGSSST